MLDTDAAPSSRARFAAYRRWKFLKDGVRAMASKRIGNQREGMCQGDTMSILYVLLHNDDSSCDLCGVSMHLAMLQ